jgi:hypothetical protein
MPVHYHLMNDEWWPDTPDDNDEHILTRKLLEDRLLLLAEQKQLREAYERLETEASRDPKAPTWGWRSFTLRRHFCSGSGCRHQGRKSAPLLNIY